MRIEKDGQPIRTVEEWAAAAPPKQRSQWQDWRSAKELARAWCGAGIPTTPPQMIDLFDSHPATRGLSVSRAIPEHRIAFDHHGGEPRNADLALVGTTASDKVAVTIEAKADEPFGPTVEEAMTEALERLIKNDRSQGVARISDLVRALFSPYQAGQPKVGSLRYQLLTATAGTLAYASQEDAGVAVLVVHEFVTPSTKDEKRAQNEEDLIAFLHRLTGRRPPKHQLVGSLHGPFQIPGPPLFGENSSLFIGKVVTVVRS